MRRYSALAKSLATGACVMTCAFVLATPASADPVYLETFDNGTALSSDSLVNYAAIDPYWKTNQNGNVVQTTNGIGGFGSAIDQDASGDGYFLFQGTSANYDPTSQATFFVSSAITVAQNTNYTVSFDLVNATSCDVSNPYGNQNCSAQVKAAINGTSLGSPVSADDVFADQVGTPANWPWQEFTFSFNSGSNTQVTLSLQDVFPGIVGFGNGTGNDFGVDDICVAGDGSCPSPTPEPASTFLFGSGLFGLVMAKRKLSRI
jgi:hypothetical protein